MLVALEVFFGNLMRRVNSIERDVQEERFLACIGFDDASRFLGNQMSAVPFVAIDRVILMPVESIITNMGVVIDRSIVVTLLMIKSTLGGQVAWLKMTEVPLADNRRCIICRLQTLS